MKWHPLALKFPALTGDDWSAFLAGIKSTKGVKTTRVLYRMVNGQREGLEGKQRWEACRVLKLPCRMQRVRVKDADVAEFIINHNCNRRHLTGEFRSKLVNELRALGQSTRKIASTLHIDPKTVRNALGSPGDNSPPEIVGRDGKTYPSKQAKPAILNPFQPSKILPDCDAIIEKIGRCVTENGLPEWDEDAARIRGLVWNLKAHIERWSESLA